MKKTRIIGLIAFSMLSLSICNVSAQVDLKKLGGKAVNKAKDKKEENKKEEVKTETPVKSTETKIENSSSTTKSTEKAQSLESGKGYFYTSFKSKSFVDEVALNDELFVRLNFGKTMIEHADANSFSSSYTAYGFVTVYIDEKKSFTTGPISFASNISKKWSHIDVPLNVSPKFPEELSKDQSQLETAQDVWVFQHLFQDKNVPKNYVASAISKMSGSNHTVTVELGLGEVNDKEPKITIAKGTVKVKVDDASRLEMAKNGPKYGIPLDATEKGKLTLSNENIIPKGGDVTMKVDLPHPPKYYNVKWCQANTCDYDHGDLLVYVELDGAYLTRWNVELWNDDYEVKKNFEMIIAPKNDADFGKSSGLFNKSTFLGKNDNVFAYALYDKIYNTNFKSGEHTLVIKVLSPNNVDLYGGVDFGATKEFFDSFSYPIAEKTVKFNLSDADRTSFLNNSSSKKLGHAGGSWAAVDAHLLKTTPNYDFATINDIACQTEWKVTTNSLGAILFRTCKADMIYTNNEGATRVVRGLEVKQKYEGGNNYSKGGITDIIQHYFTDESGFLNNFHYPVSKNKVK